MTETPQTPESQPEPEPKRNVYWPTSRSAWMAHGYELDGRAQFAREMVAQFALVAGKPGDEDSAGRQKIFLQEPNEVVDRAFRISNILFDRFEAEGIIRPSADPREQTLRDAVLETMRDEIRFPKTEEMKRMLNHLKATSAEMDIVVGQMVASLRIVAGEKPEPAPAA